MQPFHLYIIFWKIIAFAGIFAVFSTSDSQEKEKRRPLVSGVAAAATVG